MAGTDDLFTASVPPCLQALDRAEHLLGRVQASDAGVTLLSARLAPGMMNAAGQFRTVAFFTLRATFPLTGQPLPRGDFRLDAPGLAGRLAFARAEVAALTPADFAGAADRSISHRAGEADLTQTATDYLTLFALPNLWFHLSMAYAICRVQGLEIGKADYDGWHSYSPGFTFPA